MNHDLQNAQAPHNMVFDVIFCRHVMIYFDRQLQDSVLERFYNSLDKKTGYLVLSKVEITHDKRLFNKVNTAERVYQKKT
jgi:chemotaxis protein methyltransferase CheR